MHWLENKEQYIILDTETTGLDSNDQIIEIAIIDLHGNVILNTYVMPSIEISEPAQDIHGITYYFLKNENAPSWESVYPLVKEALRGKVIIAYNSTFDERMIAQTCKAYDIEVIDLTSECLMHNVMLEYSSDRYIALQSIVNTSQCHRALDDCYLCLEVNQRYSLPWECS